MRNSRGITGVEIIAMAFLGSLLAGIFMGAFVGWKARKYANKLGITSYHQIHEALGHGEVFPG